MALIRVVPKGLHTNWLKINPITASELTKDPIGYDGGPVSVFDVTTETEEARAAAAHYLTLKRNNFVVVSVLRIEPSDLGDLQIGKRKTDGETGIASIDARHRDLNGFRDQFEILMQRIHRALSSGEDRLRIVGPIQVKYQLQQFLQLDNTAVSPLAKKYCRRLIDDNNV